MELTAPLSLGQLTAIIAGVGALGTAAFGLVDAFKVLPGGGLSLAGFKFIRRVITRLAPPVKSLEPSGLGLDSMLYTLQSQWINGTDVSSQVSIAKSLIKLRLTPDTAKAMALVTGVDPDVLSAVAKNIGSGDPLSQQQSDVYGRFDLLLTTLLDQAYQRGEQRYRNVAKVAAIPVSVALALVAAYVSTIHVPHKYRLAILVGLLATPIAPIAKDLSTAITTASQSIQTLKG